MGNLVFGYCVKSSKQGPREKLKQLVQGGDRGEEKYRGIYMNLDDDRTDKLRNMKMQGRGLVLSEVS